MTSMREKMPVINIWLEIQRQKHGRDRINNLVRRGMNGEPVFYAQEDGHRVGTDPRSVQWTIGFDEYGRSYVVNEDAYPETYLFLKLV